jgi:hypothetical protein
MTIKKSDFLLNFLMFCLGATVGRRISDSYIMRHLAAKSADSMLMNLPQSSVARWRFSPPDLQNYPGFESRLAGKKYFWRTLNFWRISGGFDQFCMVCFCLADSGGFEVCISKKTNLFLNIFCFKKKWIKSNFMQNNFNVIQHKKFKEEKFFPLATSEIRRNLH